MKNCFLICFIILYSGISIAQTKSSRPNVVIILADDLGYACTQPYASNPRYSVTPNLLKFAAEGAKFSDAYVTNPVCSPSRAGIMSGRYQERFGYYANVDDQAGLPATETAMASYFKNAGYATAAIGKWNLGIKEQGQHPLDRGFDEYFGFNSTQTDYFNSPILFNGRDKVAHHKYLTFEFTDRAVDFVNRNSKKPFLLYLAYNAVHGPSQAPDDYIAKFMSKGLTKKEAVQAAMVYALDEGIGRVMQSLKENHIDDNTLIFFLSDNGGLESWWKGSNGDLNGFKREHLDGGVKVEFMMRWPGKIPGGVVQQNMVSSLDILTTSLKACQIPLPKKNKLDGEDIMPLFGKNPPVNIHNSLFWAGGNVIIKPGTPLREDKADPPPAWAVRSGDWKLLQIMETGQTYLFNIKNDVSETTDVATQHPDIVASLKSKFVEWFKTTGGQPLKYNIKYYQQLKQIK